MKYNTLGLFKYLHGKVDLRSSEDETKFVVRLWDKRSNKGVKNIKPTTVTTHESLGPARHEFQEQVERMVHNPSRSDVSIFMQQQAKSRI